MPQQRPKPQNYINAIPIQKTDEEYMDEVLVTLTSGLNMLIAQASAARMGMAARILYSAKEDLVHWAVDMNFHETAQDHFVNRHLYDNGQSTLGEFLARINTLQDESMKSEIIRILGLSMMASS